MGMSIMSNISIFKETMITPNENWNPKLTQDEEDELTRLIKQIKK